VTHRVVYVLRLYDTRTGQVEPIEPARRGELRMYSCGPPVYRYAHVGNLRTYLLADLIRRTAETHRLTVTTGQNITDVGHLADDSEIDPAGDDKVIAQARAEGKTALEIARRCEQAFRVDCAALNIRPADFAPRASESVDLMIDLISRLLETGHAYPTPDGSVYFDARSFPSYGELSGNRLDSLRPGHRSGGSVDEHKRFHADWALWKAAPAGRELTWPTPWGTGFPGWHTECSAMSLHYLGDPIDVHTGGIDLRFPHHEDERAQSNTVAGHEVVRHWVHGEHLLFEGRKMAKSTGNVVLLADLTGRGLDPLALRLAFLEQRYRQQMNLTWACLAGADRTVRRWRDRVAEWARSPSKAMSTQYVREFTAAFDDDLDTPAAVRVLRALEKDGEIPPGSKFETFAYADRLLGLDLARDIGRAPVE
jgi:cysteinyl-tRNA synthetase